MNVKLFCLVFVSIKIMLGFSNSFFGIARVIIKESIVLVCVFCLRTKKFYVCPTEQTKTKIILTIAFQVL